MMSILSLKKKRKKQSKQPLILEGKSKELQYSSPSLTPCHGGRLFASLKQEKRLIINNDANK
jgi:hypothetical protein